MILLDLAPIGPIEQKPPTEPSVPLEPVAENAVDFVFLGSAAEIIGLVFVLAMAAAAVFLIAKAIKKNKK